MLLLKIVFGNRQQVLVDYWHHAMDPFVCRSTPIIDSYPTIRVNQKMVFSLTSTVCQLLVLVSHRPRHRHCIISIHTIVISLSFDTNCF